ncbi:VOC family protein [Streptomyces sp. NPDC059564]|uniref:VOC family protein n=1 Tax=Streptomyces sp. NPDC059564 TaxID=3346865 RepID=UPI0036805501
MVLVTADVLGAPCWLSLMARDLPAAQRFYGAVFGWTFRQGGLGRAFPVAEADGVPVAGIGAMAGELAVPVAWTAYFSVDDADAAVARVRELGGTVAIGPVSSPPSGRAALVGDPEGAAFGVWEGRVLSEWSVGEGTAPAWLELHTRDAFDAALFYGEVLEWADGSAGCCEASYEEDQVVLRAAGEAVARLHSRPVEAAAQEAGRRPRWLVHFKVRDLPRATEAALAHGGTVVPQLGNEPGGGGPVTLRDPDGALFTLDVLRPPPV